ncbi:helix-turn-helix domain-containing protein [Saccharopolyspora sp. NPDC002578]
MGKSIRRLRTDAQLSQEALLARFNDEMPNERRMSASHLSRLESGSARMTPDHLGRLATVLDAENRLAELEDLRRRADEQGWWHDYADLLSEPVEMLIELGEDATTARSYDLAFVQGLLQTKAYAEAVVSTARAFVSPIDVDRMVETRMRRQQRLFDADFEGLTAVLTEGVIRTVVGGPQVMRRQLEHLLDISRQAPVTIHVLPFSAGALPGSDNVVIFGFADEDDGDVVYVDSDTAQRVYEARNPVRQCMYTFDAALAQALAPRESSDLIREVIKELTT